MKEETRGILVAVIVVIIVIIAIWILSKRTGSVDHRTFTQHTNMDWPYDPLGPDLNVSVDDLKAKCLATTGCGGFIYMKGHGAGQMRTTAVASEVLRPSSKRDTYIIDL